MQTALLVDVFLCIFATALINISENTQRHNANAEINSAGSIWSVSAFMKDIKQKTEHLDEESPISRLSNVIVRKPPLVRLSLQSSGRSRQINHEVNFRQSLEDSTKGGGESAVRS